MDISLNSKTFLEDKSMGGKIKKGGKKRIIEKLSGN